MYLKADAFFCYKNITRNNEVIIRSPNQGLGSIPQITSVMIPEQHFLSAGIESQNQKLLPLGSDAKF